MHTLLIVDDLEGVRNELTSILVDEVDADILHAGDGLEAKEITERRPVDLVLSDIRMPRMNGIALVRELVPRRIPVVLHSSYSDVDVAIEGVRLGAADFISSPIQRDRLLSTVRRILREEVSAELVGVSDAARALRELARACARGAAPVWIVGETGAGKESFARAVMEQGRVEGPFVRVHAPSMSTRADWLSAAQQAEGGALLLDLIFECDAAQQGTLIGCVDALDNGSVRLFTTSFHEIQEHVADLRFRADLWHRLTGFQIVIPPLRERPSDLPDLVLHRLRKRSLTRAGLRYHIDPDALTLLARHTWPGNVRELFQCVDRMADLAGDRRTLYAEDARAAMRSVSSQITARGHNDDQRRRELIAALDLNDWNVAATARSLGVKRSTLRYRLERYGLS